MVESGIKKGADLASSHKTCPTCRAKTHLSDRNCRGCGHLFNDSEPLLPEKVPDTRTAWQRLHWWWKLAYIYFGLAFMAQAPRRLEGITEGGAALLDAVTSIPIDCLSIWIFFGTPRLLWLGGRWLYGKVTVGR